ncbi:MAG: GMC family oxidoreductase [Phycisphaeraceae bacterium]|nr:GMC family oxidoreductase [Phycisphaeraceae bacterium]
MIRDLRELPLSGDIEADLCIVGAGAAGITIARRFTGSNASVCLIESGALAFDESVQDMYRGESAGTYYGLHTTRLRYFGGATNHWTGVCGLQDPMDFQPRPWIGSPGWPITRSELMPFYERAHEILDLGPFEYDLSRVAPERRFPAFDPDKLTIRVLRSSPPTRFNEKYVHQIRDSANVLCLLNANAVDFETTHGASHVSSVRVATIGGESHLVRARVVVLACGGLENPRLLLNASATPNGLGNASGLVGRYFADHLQHRSMAIVVTSGDWWQAFGRFDRGVSRATPSICLGEEAQRREGLLSWRGGLWRTDPPPGVRAGATCLSIFGHCEQMPSTDNRVELGDERDVLGLRRIRLHWAISETERRTMERSLVIEAEELGRLRLGFLRLDARLEPGPELSRGISRAGHHMCTTRMSAEPHTGVVNTDCRLHDVENMYVAGSSVFPACGQINPTLTLVALAIRLGDHLAERLGA